MVFLTVILLQLELKLPWFSFTIHNHHPSLIPIEGKGKQVSHIQGSFFFLDLGLEGQRGTANMDMIGDLYNNLGYLTVTKRIVPH